MFNKLMSYTMAILVGATISMSAMAQEDATTTTTTTTTANPATGTTTTVVEKKTIITPAPKSASCNTVAAHWEDNVWVDQQTICKYEGRTEGVEWVQDYWACTVFTADGNCTSWEYRPGYWIKTTK